MAFIIGLPAVQIILFCLSIGKDPRNLPIAIVNNDFNSSKQGCEIINGCVYENLSCRFLSKLEDRTLKLLNYDTDEEARYAVEKGWAWASINFPSNYSESLMNRIELGTDADPWSVIFSEMSVQMDMSSEFSFFHMKLTFFNNFVLNNFHFIYLQFVAKIRQIFCDLK